MSAEQLRPRRFHAANKVYSLPGGTEDNDLWVEVFHARDEVIGDQIGIRSVFVPTDKQRQRIADGENITLTILYPEQPPIMLAITDEPIGKPPNEPESPSP